MVLTISIIFNNHHFSMRPDDQKGSSMSSDAGHC